ncbi:hypothetical protein [Aliagarivorans marinus]|uniref:hypothetical protein n=1 Tax=Aliagarivorans marinus TaxID=561965 RepID=UPI00047C37D2|nr:hypothetical protein [Aliagarivorans marinus]
MISKWSLLLGLACWPALASQSWQFGDTQYQVTGEQPVQVTISASKGLNDAQLQRLCRRGLGLPLRAKYESQLLEQARIEKPLSSWPIAGLSYQTQSLRFKKHGPGSASCSAMVSEQNPEQNLALTSLHYGYHYHRQQQADALVAALRLPLSHSYTANDAAALVLLMLQASQPEQADSYYQQYVANKPLLNQGLYLEIARWQAESSREDDAQATLAQCSLAECDNYSVELQLLQVQRDQDSVSDLGAYFSIERE